MVSVALGGCSLKQIAMRSLADAVAEPGGVYARDDDPELVRESLPTMLKVMEQLADGLPTHEGIRIGLARGFTSYAVGFVQEDADRLNEHDVQRARELYARSRRLTLRAYHYGLDGLEHAVPGMKRALVEGSREERAQALQRANKATVPLLYWTGAALGSAVSVSKDDMHLVGQLPVVADLMRRALALDEAYDEGAIHEFFIQYDASQGAAQGGGPKEAKKHFDRAVELSKGKKLSPYVTWAEAIDVDQQNKKEFTDYLGKVLAYDVQADPEHRLVNVLAQSRARWLLSRTGDLFAE